jgi:hypothetical protein
VETTSAEVIDTFASTPRALNLLRRWQQDPDRPLVARAVLAHTTRTLYDLEPRHVEAVCVATEHPLGDIRKEVAMGVQPIVDWRPDFAFTHVMHFAVERLCGLPSFQDFSRFCADDPVGVTALGNPARQIREDASRQGYPPSQVSQAVRWRIGLAYYSFVREVYTIAVLRAAGLDVRAHPLADALFRVDAWTGRTVLSLYISNPRFRDGARGRKPRTVDILAGATPRFRHEELRLTTRHEFGCVHLPEAEQITAIARRIKAADRVLPAGLAALLSAHRRLAAFLARIQDCLLALAAAAPIEHEQRGRLDQVAQLRVAVAA